MWRTGGTYVRIDGDRDALKCSLRGLGKLYRGESFSHPPGHAFAMLDRQGRGLNHPDWVYQDLDDAMRRALSRHHDVLFLYYCDPEPDESVYCHWKGGELVRALHASLGRWMTSTGQSEAWEAGYFFTDAQVTRALRYLDEDQDGARAEATYRQALSARRFEAQSRFPEAGPGMVEAIRAHFGLWDPWESGVWESSQVSMIEEEEEEEEE